jgi:rhodanese-related sulfurtransferase
LKKIAVLLICIFLLGCGWAQAGQAIRLLISGVEAGEGVSVILKSGRIYVPIRFVSEQLGAHVAWDEKNGTVTIDDQRGELYLGKADNLISPAGLKKILDDDNDNSLADYRTGHNTGDQIGNDPLVVDVRNKAVYDPAHVPGAVWIAPAENMAEKQNIAELKRLLAEHAARGGLNEIVVYCADGSSSGLVAGVLGAQGLPVKNMTGGFDVGWRGTKLADRAIKAPMEDSAGKTTHCGG